MHTRLSLHAAQLSSAADISPLKSKEPSASYFFHCKEAMIVPFNRQVTTAKLSLKFLQISGKC